MDTVSCIAHITGNYFFLGAARIYTVCLLDKNTNIFKEVSRVKITDEDINMIKRPGYSIISQGIYYANNKLYKVYAHEEPNKK